MISRDKYFVALAEKGKREDGRKADDFREIKVETGIIEKAEGSAMAQIGSTQIIAGVKMDIKEPFQDSPDEGILMVGAELSPIASPEFESGPPNENSIELARVVDRGIRESKAIDVKKLCIVKAEKVWVVNLDIYLINNSGNMIDTAGLAAIAALNTTRLPKYEDEKIIRGEYKGKLPVDKKPIPVTHINIGNNLFVDPTYEEERIAEASLTVTSMDNGHITSLQKRGSKGLTLKEIEKILDKAVKKGKEIRKHL